MQVTEEVAAHLKEGGIVVKPYDAMLDDVREAASSGLRLWTDPAKASSLHLMYPSFSPEVLEVKCSRELTVSLM